MEGSGGEEMGRAILNSSETGFLLDFQISKFQSEHALLFQPTQVRYDSDLHMSYCMPQH